MNFEFDEYYMCVDCGCLTKKPFIATYHQKYGIALCDKCTDKLFLKLKNYIEYPENRKTVEKLMWE